jgi:glutamate--cysteine ligase
VPREGLNAKIKGRTVREIGYDVLGIARTGLQARAKLNSEGFDEAHFLAPLEESIARGTTLAEEMLALYNGRWQGSVDPVFADYAY